MEIDINSREEKLSEMINNLIGKEDNSPGIGEPTPTDGSSDDDDTDATLKYPDVESKFFKSTETKSSWWENNKLFCVFVLLVIFAAFVLCKLICCVCDKDVPHKNLLFFFGVITLFFVGLAVLAYFIIKASEKHRAVENEKENKMFAFRLKMLESAFELENRKIIAEKHRMEKEISITDKERLYTLDEQQRAADNKRRMQLRKYEILENYMKHIVELAKTGEQSKGNTDLLRVVGIINKKEQAAVDSNNTKENPGAREEEGEGREKKSENLTQKQQTTSAEAAQEEGESDKAEKNNVAEAAPAVKDSEEGKTEK